MSRKKEKTLYIKLSNKGFMPVHAAEVGVNTPKSSNIYDYIEKGVRSTLVEPDPTSVKEIMDLFASHDNVTLHAVAAYDFSGDLELQQRGPSTYVSELKSSPAMVNDGDKADAENKFTVRSVTFNEIDDGTIDLLSVDVEGSEWFVIKHMTSRPAVISIETHGALYTNPYLAEIKKWMAENIYTVWYKGKTDSVFVKNGSLKITLLDRITLCGMNAYLAIRRKRKAIRRYFKK